MKWLRGGRPDEISDTLDAFWYAMMEGDNWKADQAFIHGRGPLINDDNPEDPSKIDHDPKQGNGFCFAWLEWFEKQEKMMRQYQNG